MRPATATSSEVRGCRRGGEGHGHAPAADADERLAAGDRGVEGDAAHEPRRGAEVVEVEGPRLRVPLN